MVLLKIIECSCLENLSITLAFQNHSLQLGDDFDIFSDLQKKVEYWKKSHVNKRQCVINVNVSSIMEWKIVS